MDVPPGYGGAALLAERIERFASDYRTEAFALRFLDYGREAPRALQAWTQAHVRFVREIGEVFAAPWVTLELGYGDCDDHATLVASTLSALGFRVALGFVEDAKGVPTHVWALVHDGNAWRHLETTVRARYGEAPLDAAARLGLARVDIGAKTLSHLDTMAFRDAMLDANEFALEGGLRVWLRLGVWDGDNLSAIGRVLERQGFRDLEFFEGSAMPMGQSPLEWAPDPIGPTVPHTRELRATGLYAFPGCRVLPALIGFDAGAHVMVFGAWTLDPSAEGMQGLGAATSVLAQARAATSWLTDDFFEAIIAVARKHRMRPRDLLIVLHRESGLRKSAVNLQNGFPVAVGLLQVTQIARDGLGLTEAQRVALVSVSERDQVVRVVDKYFASVAGFRSGRAYPDAVNVYQAVFAPATMRLGDDRHVVLYRAPTREYEQNKSVDPVRADGTRKGWIELGDLDRFLEPSRKSATYQAALVRLEALGGGDGGGLGVGAAVAGLVALGTAAWAAGVRLPS